jgi:CRISPR-associated protein Cas5d
MNENLINIRVWGDFACWSRPELKVERVSYPVMTPSSARGILDAI